MEKPVPHSLPQASKDPRENDPENLLTEHEVRFTQEGIPTKALRARLS